MVDVINPIYNHSTLNHNTLNNSVANDMPRLSSRRPIFEPQNINNSNTINNQIILYNINEVLDIGTTNDTKNKSSNFIVKNLKNIITLERAMKDLIEEFRSLELNFTEQKKILQDYKYTLEKLDLEISRLADSNKGDTNITTAIQMANQGRNIDEIFQLNKNNF